MFSLEGRGPFCKPANRIRQIYLFFLLEGEHASWLVYPLYSELAGTGISADYYPVQDEAPVRARAPARAASTSFGPRWRSGSDGRFVLAPVITMAIKTERAGQRPLLCSARLL